MKNTIWVSALLASLACPPLLAQHAAFRIKGRVVTERGEPVDKADVRLEAFYGYAGGTFAGVRKFSTETNAKGEWNVGGMQPGVWLFEVTAPGYLPETVALPIRILASVSMGTSGMSLTWDLVLKPVKPSADVKGQLLTQATTFARDGKTDEARTALQTVPEGADADFFTGAGRVALVARDFALARTLFVKGLEQDPASYRAALGIASTFLLQRDFDSASRTFDAARNRTHDKDEIKFITIALSELALIKVR